MKVLVTGGAGSFGQAFVSAVLPTAERVVVYSRDEGKHARFAEILQAPPEKIRFFLGDVRDRERLEEAMWRCDTVVHAAALKRIDAVSYDPLETIRTNVLGTVNVIDAAIRAGVGRVVVLSSDKCCDPANLYGVTKLAAEFYAVQANAHALPRGTRIACVRWGNVLGSRGSVVHVWRRQVAAGLPLTVTDPECTRFWITFPQAVAFVLESLAQMRGGEVFVPQLPSLRLGDLAECVAPGHPVKIVGLRPGGEKRHETLVTAEEMHRAVGFVGFGFDGRFIIEPTHMRWGRESWRKEPGALILLPPPHVAFRSDEGAVRIEPAMMRQWLRDLPEEAL